MKIKDGFQLRDVAGTNVVVPVGITVESYNNMLMLNDVGAFLWKRMEKNVTEAELCTAVLSEYEVEDSRAKAAVYKFVDTLRQEKLLEE